MFSLRFPRMMRGSSRREWWKSVQTLTFLFDLHIADQLCWEFPWTFFPFSEVWVPYYRQALNNSCGCFWVKWRLASSSCVSCPLHIWWRSFDFPNNIRFKTNNLKHHYCCSRCCLPIFDGTTVDEALSGIAIIGRGINVKLDVLRGSWGSDRRPLHCGLEFLPNMCCLTFVLSMQTLMPAFSVGYILNIHCRRVVHYLLG